MAAGRKRMNLDAKQIEEVRRMAEKGIPIELMGHIFGIAPRTMEKRMKDQPAVREAYLIGATKAAAEVYSNAWLQATTSDNPAWAIFYMKTRGARLMGNEEDFDIPDLDVDKLKLAVGA